MGKAQASGLHNLAVRAQYGNGRARECRSSVFVHSIHLFQRALI